MISVIIPAYNYGKYLSETLQSVKNQSYTDWECIIVDDGSMDNTRDVAGIFVQHDPRFKYIYQNNKGVSAARNTGLKSAYGKFIQFLDGDDLLQADKLLFQSDFLKNNSQVDIVYSNFQHFAHGAIPQYKDGEYPEEHKVSCSGQNLVAIFLKRNFIRMNTPMIRKKVIDEVGFFNEKLSSLEDWEFWMRCACQNKYFTFIEKENANAMVRINPEGLSKQVDQMQQNYLPVLQNIFVSEPLNLLNKLNLLSRYELIFFNLLIKQHHQIIFTMKKITFFKLIVVCYAPFFFPIYLVIKMYHLIRK
jgi:glycosyltransferase involved in cell wall biosynthesis